MIWQLRVWVKWDVNTLNNTISQIKTEFKKAWNDIEKSLNSWAEKWLKEIWNESKKTINNIAWLNEKLEVLRKKLNFSEIWSKEFKKLQNEIKNTEKELSKAIDSTWLLQKAFWWLKWYLAWIFAITWISQLVSWIISLWTNLEKAQIWFTTILWSSEQAKKTLSELTEFAKSTPFEIVWLRDTARQLLAFWFTSNELIPTMKSLWDVAAGLSVPIEQIAYAYGQVRVANQLYGTELMQFTQAWVPLLEELAKMFWVTQAEVKKMVENWKVWFKDVEKAFQSMSWEWWKFFNLMDKQSKSVAWQWSNLKDTATQLWEKIWTALLPTLQKWIDLLNNIVDFTKEYSKQIWFLILALVTLIWARWLTWLLTILTTLIPAIKWSAFATTLLSWSINLASFSMKAFIIASAPMLWTLALITSALWWATQAYKAYSTALELIDSTNKMQESQDKMYEVMNKWVNDRKKAISDLKQQNEDLIKSDDINAKKQIEINNKKIEANKKFLNSNLELAKMGNTSMSEQDRLKLNKDGVALMKEAQIEQDKLWNSFVKTWEKTKVTLGWLNNSLKEMNDTLDNTEVWTKEFEDLKNEISKTEKQIKSLSWTSESSWNKSAEATKNAKEKTEELQDKVKDLKDEYDDYEKLIKDIDDSQNKYYENSIKYNEEIDNWIRKINNSLKDQAIQYQKNIDLIESERKNKIAEEQTSTWEKIAERILEIEKEKKELELDIKKSTEKWINIKTAKYYWKKTLEDVWEWKLWEWITWNEYLEVLKISEKIESLNNEEIEAKKIVNEEILKSKRIYQDSTELQRILIDQQEEISKINAEQDDKAKEALEKYEKEKQSLQDFKNIYEAFQNNKKLTPEELEKALADEGFQRLSQEEQDLIIKLSKEKISLTEQKDFIIWLENELNQAKIDLSKNTTEMLKADISSLSNDYKTLISEIQTAISKQNELNSLKNSSSNIEWFAEGWYTWDWWKYEPAWVVHKWEYVVPQSVISKMPDIVPKLENLRQWWSISNDYSKKIDVWAITVQSQVDLELFFDKLKFKL